MKYNKIIQILIFATLALSSGVCAQNCKDGSNYTAYVGDLPDGQSPVELCECIRDNLDKSGQLKGKTFDCIENKELETIRFVSAKDDGQSNECGQCLNGCKKIAAASSSDDRRICDVIIGSDVKASTSVKRAERAALLQFRCYLIFQIGWFSIRIIFRCVW